MDYDAQKGLCRLRRNTTVWNLIKQLDTAVESIQSLLRPKVKRIDNNNVEHLKEKLFTGNYTDTIMKF
jgi:hypothetical protein